MTNTISNSKRRTLSSIHFFRWFLIVVMLSCLLSLSFFSFTYATSDSKDKLEQEIEEISQGTDLILSGTFDNEHETLWLLFDNNTVVILLRDESLPPLFYIENQHWLAIAPNASIYLLRDMNGDIAVPNSPLECAHDYQATVIKEATETEDGETLYTCTLCGKDYTIVTYYQEDALHYYLVANVNGQEFTIEITEDNANLIPIIVGIEYKLVKLSKTSKPVTKIRVTRILRYSTKKSAARSAVFLLYDNSPAPEDDQYIQQEICMISASEPGTETLYLDFEDNTTQSLTFVATAPDNQTEDSQQQTEGSQQQTEGSQQQTEDSQQQTEDCQQQTEDSQQQTEDSQQQMEDSQQQTEAHQPQTEAPQEQTAALETRFTYKNATYSVTIKDQSVSLVSMNNSSVSSFTVPATVPYQGINYKVTAINANAFANKKKLTSVTLGKNVTKLGSKVFSGCKKLKTIKITSKNLEKNCVVSNTFKHIKNTRKLTIKVPKKKLKAYKKLLKKGGVPSSSRFAGF